MIYKKIFNSLNQGQEVFARTSLTTGELTIINKATVGLFQGEYIEHFAPLPQLVLLGAGHVSIAVCRVCSPLGFKVIVVDEREQFANRASFPLASEILVKPFDEFLQKHQGGDNVYYAVLTRGHMQDRLCLEYLLKNTAAYIGMIGSKRKNAMVFSQLLATGFTDADIAKVYAPIGIDIGADTPHEIAISIAAQLIKVRSEHTSGNAFDAAVLHSLCHSQVRVMATICSKSGSAPRCEGAKMALLKNGDLVGTVGGGKGEAQVIELMRSQTANVPLIVDIEMSNKSASAEGLICGGSIKVLISNV